MTNEITLKLSTEEFYKIMDILQACDDEGPDGEGWQSIGLELLCLNLEEQARVQLEEEDET